MNRSSPEEEGNKKITNVKTFSVPFPLRENQELENRSGKRTQGFYVPSNGWSKRAYVAGTASAGGILVATDLLADNFTKMVIQEQLML